MKIDITKSNVDRLPVWAYLLKRYVRLMFNKLYYRYVYIAGQDNIPPKGSAVLIASNHQNCMMDPLAILFSLDRHAKFLTRASVFNNPKIAKFLREIGLLPAYRLGFEGIEAVKNNEDTFSTSEKELLKGHPIVIFPEGMHQHRRFLGEFSFGYTKMAFEAAQLSNWEKEVFILPSANHYKHWGHMQSDLVVSFGEPVSLKPYYELYQSKPRTAQREVNKLVRQRISEMMLNIEDQENYEAIEFLTRSYAVDYAIKQGKNPADLQDMLWAGKSIVSSIARIKDNKPELAKQIFDKACLLNRMMQDQKVRDWLFREKPSVLNVVLTSVVMIILFPLFVLSLIPNILVFIAPYFVLPKIKDWMFYSSVFFGVSLITIPLLYTITYIILGVISDCWLISLIYTMLLPFLGLFAWNYRREFIKLVGKIKYQKCVNTKKNADIAPQREALWALLEKEII